jgi:hypothetical protein
VRYFLVLGTTILTVWARPAAAQTDKKLFFLDWRTTLTSNFPSTDYVRYVNFPSRFFVGGTVAKNWLLAAGLKTDVFFRGYPPGSIRPTTERFYAELKPISRYYFASESRAFAPYLEANASVNYGHFLEHRLEAEVDPTFSPYAYSRGGASWSAGGAVGLALLLDKNSVFDFRLGYDYLPSAAVFDPSLHRLALSAGLNGFLGGFAGVAGREFCAAKSRAGNFFFITELQSQWLSSGRFHFFLPFRFGTILADKLAVGPTFEASAFGDENIRAANVHAGPFLRYFIPGNGVMPFIEMMGSVGFFRASNYPFGANYTSTYATARFGGSVGLDFFVAQTLGLEIEFFYRPYRYYGSGRRFVFDHSFGLRVGMIAFVDKKK